MAARSAQTYSSMRHPRSGSSSMHHSTWITSRWSRSCTNSPLSRRRSREATCVSSQRIDTISSPAGTNLRAMSSGCRVVTCRSAMSTSPIRRS
ncbi:MAG: hypothetical protein U0324_29520 [Polyangiales bacterium]